MKKRIPFLVLVSASLLATGACARTPPEVQTATTRPAEQSAAQPVVEASVEAPSHPAGNAFPMLVVHKSPTCGCCQAWVEHMRVAGFPVEVREADNLEPVKSRVGVPLGKGSCHTAEIAGYFIEGHIPADDVKRLLADKPLAKGLVLPGMPLGSPGMEMPDGTRQPYTVELVGEDGSTKVFARH